MSRLPSLLCAALLLAVLLLAPLSAGAFPPTLAAPPAQAVPLLEPRVYLPFLVKPPPETVVLAALEPGTLYPGLSASGNSNDAILAPILVGCMHQNDKTEWVALGCESVPTVDNGGAQWVGTGDDRHLEVTYKIRDDWRWTDGTPVTTVDVLAWWKLNMSPGFVPIDRSGFLRIYDIVAVNDKTARVVWLSHQQAHAAEAGTLTGNVPFASFRNDYLNAGLSATGQPVISTTYWTLIGWLPAHIVNATPPEDQDTSIYATRPVGDGPYVVKDWKAGQEIALERSSLPFPLGNPQLRNIVFRFYSNTGEVLAALQTGVIDATTSDSPLGGPTRLPWMRSRPRAASNSGGMTSMPGSTST